MPNYTLYPPRNGIPINLLVEAGSVIDAPIVLDWAIGLPFSHVRTWCERTGWVIVPEIEMRTVYEFIHGGSTYYIHIRRQRIESITCDGEDIKWKDLPSEVKVMML
ncbi:MAG: hypothetical protein KGL39_08465 [Patescibacteria group bacterium]|nr:hypothetical protein [Patescibacteria group bacterium]